MVSIAYSYGIDTTDTDYSSDTVTDSKKVFDYNWLEDEKEGGKKDGK